MFQITLERPSDGPEIEALLDHSFGPGRLQRSAYSLRCAAPAQSDLCFVIRQEDELCATIRFWPVAIGAGRSALLLGPLAVSERCRGQGLGRSLIAHGLQQAQALGYDVVLVIGERDYYRPFGFSQALTRDLQLPCAVTSGCFQACELVPGAMSGLAGPVSPAVEAACSA